MIVMLLCGPVPAEKANAVALFGYSSAPYGIWIDIDTPLCPQSPVLGRRRSRREGKRGVIARLRYPGMLAAHSEFDGRRER